MNEEQKPPKEAHIWALTFFNELSLRPSSAFWFAQREHLTLPDFAGAKDFLQISPQSTLLHASYLGYQNVEDFTGQSKTETKDDAKTDIEIPNPHGKLYVLDLDDDPKEDN